MAYDILSIGDGEMLYQAFQGVAMIFGNNSLNKLINAGFTLGLLLISINYLTNQEFPLRYAKVGLIAYSAMFVPKETVVIEDVYSGEVRTVANVPLGVAMPMSVISTMGVKMTDMFETAFSVPSEASLLNSKYLNSLNTLIKLQNLGLGTAGSDSHLAGSLGETLNSYIESCVMFDLERGGSDAEVTVESLRKSNNLLEALATSFVNIDVLVKLPSSGPAGSQKNCKEAYQDIRNYMQTSDLQDSMDRYVKGLLGIKAKDITASNTVDQALTALDQAQIDSQTYMQNALLSSYLKDGPVAFIQRQGKEQLNMQWASEQSMFNEIAKPLMAFVEMFTVAISPIVAFLTTLGPIGLTMMTRYVQLMIWIALWGPLMAVCNLYITVVTTRALTAIEANGVENGSGLTAMINHDQLYGTLETWLSAGGMLASSVPALALMIVYGGSVAATNLSGKMMSAASSSVNPGRLRQDAYQSTPAMTLGSKTETSPNAGTKLSGMADTNYSASSTFGRASQSALGSLRSASSSAGETLSKINQLSTRSGSMSSQASAVTSAMNNMTSEGSNWSSSDGRMTSSSQKMSAQESEAVQAGVNGALKAGLGSNMVGASVQASLMSTSGISANRAKELGDMAQHAVNSGVGGSDVTTTSIGSSNTSTNQSFESSEAMAALGKQYQSQLQAVEQASEQYTQTSSLQDSAGKSLSMPYQDLARRLNNSGAIVDIKQAQEQLRSKLGENDYGELSNQAQYEINRSSASSIVGGDRDALAGFLMLNQQDPLKAGQILNEHIMPTNTSSGVDFGHDTYSKNNTNLDGIVSEKMAGEFKSKAQGDNDDSNTDVAGKTGNTHSSPPSQTSHGHANKSTNSQGFGSKSSQANAVGGNSAKSKVMNELNGHKVQSEGFVNGGKLATESINGSGLALSAGKNFSEASGDIAQDAAKEGNKQISTAQDKMSSYGKLSADSFKESMGMKDKKPSKSDLPNPRSDNDLPPINK